MIDWSEPESGAWIHDNRRKPFMVDYGVRVHWTDLGEPEFFSEHARYAGHDLDGDGSLRTGQADIANVYNLFWHRSIDDGYSRNRPRPAAAAADPGRHRRHPAVRRRGVVGRHRAAGCRCWSPTAQPGPHVVLRASTTTAPTSAASAASTPTPSCLDELYTQWFANSAWFDVPLRPHVNNFEFYNERSDDKPDGPRRHRVAPYEVGPPAEQPGEPADPLRAHPVLLLAGPPGVARRHPDDAATGPRPPRRRAVRHRAPEADRRRT